MKYFEEWLRASAKPPLWVLQHKDSDPEGRRGHSYSGSSRPHQSPGAKPAQGNVGQLFWRRASTGLSTCHTCHQVCLATTWPQQSGVTALFCSHWPCSPHAAQCISYLGGLLKAQTNLCRLAMVKVPVLTLDKEWTLFFQAFWLTSVCQICYDVIKHDSTAISCQQTSSCHVSTKFGPRAGEPTSLYQQQLWQLF